MNIIIPCLLIFFTWAEKHKSVTFDSIFVIKFQRLSNRMLPCESLFEYVFHKFDQRFLNKTKLNFKLNNNNKNEVVLKSTST